MMFELDKLDSLPATFAENSDIAQLTMSPAMLMSGWFSTSRMEKHYNKILKQAQVGRDNPTDLGPFFICWGIFCSYLLKSCIIHYIICTSSKDSRGE